MKARALQLLVLIVATFTSGIASAANITNLNTLQANLTASQVTGLASDFSTSSTIVDQVGTLTGSTLDTGTQILAAGVAGLNQLFPTSGRAVNDPTAQWWYTPVVGAVEGGKLGGTASPLDVLPLLAVVAAVIVLLVLTRLKSWHVPVIVFLLLAPITAIPAYSPAGNGAPLILRVEASVPSTGTWALNVSTVVIVAKYNAQGIPSDPVDIYNKLASWANPGELLLVNSGVLGNKTINIHILKPGLTQDCPNSPLGTTSVKFGFLVKTDGTVYVWIYRKYWDHRDYGLLLYIYWYDVRLSFIEFLRMLLSQLGVNIDATTIINGVSVYDPNYPTAASIEVLTTGVIGTGPVKSSHYFYLPQQPLAAKYVWVIYAISASSEFLINGSRVDYAKASTGVVLASPGSNDIPPYTPITFGFKATGVECGARGGGALLILIYH